MLKATPSGIAYCKPLSDSAESSLHLAYWNSQSWFSYHLTHSSLHILHRQLSKKMDLTAFQYAWMESPFTNVQEVTWKESYWPKLDAESKGVLLMVQGVGDMFVPTAKDEEVLQLNSCFRIVLKQVQPVGWFKLDNVSNNTSSNITTTSTQSNKKSRLLNPLLQRTLKRNRPTFDNEDET